MNVTITQFVRPVKLAFLITPNSKKSYLRAVQLCSALWGGACFPILPFYKLISRKFRFEYRLSDKTKDFYLYTLDNFDPDVIVLDDNIDEKAAEFFTGGRPVITMNLLEKSFSDEEEGYGIGLEIILKAVKEQDFKFHRTDGLKIRIPSISQTNLLAATLLGSVSPETQARLKAIGLAKPYCSFHKLPDIDPDGYFEPEILTGLDLTLHSLENVGSKGWSSETAIFLVNPDRLEDLLLFWNLRALGWNMLALPVNDYRREFWTKRIRRQQHLYHSHYNFDNHIHLMSGYGLSRELVRDVQSYLNTIQVDPTKEIRYSHHWWIPRFWHDSQHLHYDKAWAISPRGSQKELLFDWDTQSLLQVNVLKPSFDVSAYRRKRLCFVNEVRYTYDGMQPQYAQVFPAMPSEKIERMTLWGYKQWRFSHRGNFFLSAGWDTRIDIKIPDSERVFREWFAHYNFSIRHSAAGKLAKQLLINIGDMYGVNMFANPGILPILSLFEGGKVVNKNLLFGESTKQLKLHESNFRVKGVKNIVDGLIKKGIIQAGFQIQCSFCNQHSFYTLTELNERLRCSACQNTFLAPIHNPDDIKWAYRGLGPFSRNNRAEGIIAVLLTLRFFRVTLRHDSQITSTLNFDILENEKVINEVDLALFRKEFQGSSMPTDLFFCECKTEINFAPKDAERMKRIGDRFPGSILVFATLKYQLSIAEKELIRKLVKYFRGGLKGRPRNSILILTGNELMNRLFGLEHFREEINRYNPNHDDVGRLCDITCREYLGLPTHESEVYERVEIIQKKQDAQKILKKALISDLLQNLTNYLQNFRTHVT